MEIKYRDIVLRDMTESDIADEIRWYTEETAWTRWDAPWELEEEVKNFDAEACKKERLAFLAKEKPEIRTSMELCTESGVHIGSVAAYYIDESCNWLPRKDITPEKRKFRTLGLDLCESGFWGKGLGKQALAAWILYFQKCGEQELYVQTWSGNERMLKAAKRLGFTVCCRKAGIREIRNARYDGLTLRLDPAAFARYLLTENLKDLRFSPEDTEAVLNAYDQKPQFFEEAAKNAYHGEAPDFPICELPPLERLIVWCRRLTDVSRRYEKLGVSREIVLDTLLDISLRKGLYREKNGALGLSREDVIWFRHWENACIFRLGALQFQLFSMVYLDKEGCGEDYMTFLSSIKKKLPPGTPVLNVHIPKGADLSPEAVSASFAAAKTFFPAYFPGHNARYFLCYSWLLYPGLQKLMPESSRILQFASRFRIIGSAADSKQAVERIYGGDGVYPQETSLQRAAMHRFSELGFACGILEIP